MNKSNNGNYLEHDLLNSNLIFLNNSISSNASNNNSEYKLTQRPYHDIQGETYTKNENFSNQNNDKLDTKTCNFKKSHNSENIIKLDITGIYRFKPSGIGDSWLIGTDVDSNDASNRANAFKSGISDCPPDLTIPSTLTDENGVTKKVEIIGPYAFCACADKDNNGKTKKLTLTKQVKIIKHYGLGSMWDLIEFVLEEGSVLETIEADGLNAIGYRFGSSDESKRGTLTLPSTLSSVFRDGIYKCNLFKVIIYCGSHPLSNTSTLENAVSKTKVKVSSRYPSDENIFGINPDRNSEAEVHEECMKMAAVPAIISCSVTHKFPFMVLHASLLLSDNNKEEEDYSFAKAQVRVVVDKCDESQTTKGSLISRGHKWSKLKKATVT